MAARYNANRQTTGRRSAQGAYIYGNTVRQAEVMPKRREIEEIPQPQKRVSHQVQKNRKKALHMNPAYVLFLTMAAILALGVCVWYLQVRTELTSRTENITALQQELAQVKEENNTRYNTIIDSVNLEEVREKAINEMGMVYASKDQVVTYQNPVNDYVKQYQEIPESGVLAQSDKAEK